MDWILNNVYASVVTVGFIGSLSVNFYKTNRAIEKTEQLENHIKDEIKALEDKLEKQKDEYQKLIDRILIGQENIIKQMTDGFNRLDDRIFGLVKNKEV